jgi:hypothetical protein
MNFLEIETEKEQFEQQSREEGKKAFDEIAGRLHYRNLYWMSQLGEDERTWENMLNCTRTEPENWKEESGEYDRDAFASGFFERFDEVWEEFQAWYRRLSE